MFFNLTLFDFSVIFTPYIITQAVNSETLVMIDILNTFGKRRNFDIF